MCNMTVKMKTLNGTAAAVLACLSTGEHSGYDVDRALTSLAGDFWNVTTSQVYRELQAMAAQGLVRAGPPGPRDRRAYSLTEAGRAALDAWLSERPASDVVRIPILLKLFILFALERTDDPAMAAMAEAYRAEHEQQAERYRKQLAEMEDAGLPFAHLLRYGLFHEEAVLRWLDTLPWRGEPTPDGRGDRE